MKRALSISENEVESIVKKIKKEEYKELYNNYRRFTKGFVNNAQKMAHLKECNIETLELFISINLLNFQTYHDSVKESLLSLHKNNIMKCNSINIKMNEIYYEITKICNKIIQIKQNNQN